MNIDWDSVADEAHEGLAKDLGDLSRRFDAGRIQSYLIVYQWIDDTDLKKPAITMVYEYNQPLTALGMAVHAQHLLQNGFQDAEVEG